MHFALQAESQQYPSTQNPLWHHAFAEQRSPTFNGEAGGSGGALAGALGLAAGNGPAFLGGAPVLPALLPALGEEAEAATALCAAGDCPP